jgi:hypothetical protein
MFRLWIDWDYGQDNIVFTSRQNAIDWFNSLDFVVDASEDDKEELNFESLEEQRITSIQELTVI